MLSSGGQKDEIRDLNGVAIQSEPLDPDLTFYESRISDDDSKREVNENKEHEETRIIRGTEEVFQMASKIIQNCKSNYDLYNDNKGPSVIIEIPQYNRIHSDLKKRKVKVRLITEITSGNINYCKQLVKEFDIEIRHLQNLKGNFGIIDKKDYIATATIYEKRPITTLTYSNVIEIVKQNHFIFDTLWEKATPAERRIREIEEGGLSVVTSVVDDPGKINEHILDIVKRSNNGLSNCSTIGGFRMIYENKNLYHAYVNLTSKFRQGKAKGNVRWITHIENNNNQIALINKFLNIGIEIRHVNNLPPISFALSDRQFQGTIEKMDKGEMFRNILYSTEPLYIQHFQYFFEDLWNSAIDVRERIRQIESGIAPEMTQIIEDSNKSRKLLLHLLKSAKDEILIVYPSSKAVDLQKRIGVIDILYRKSQLGLKIRVVSPKNLNLERLLLPSHSQPGSHVSKNIAIREILKQHDLKPTIMMVDRKHVLILELKNESSTNFEEATGLTTYSRSYPTVLSYISIFDSFWEQTEMSISLGIANEKLIQNEEMEKEFINTAAHELRTPTQAIIGYTELDEELLDDILKEIKVYENEGLNRNIVQLHKHFDTISRNASRLDQLINNLLDVARIESGSINSLQLQREKLNLVNEINECLKTQLDQKLKAKNIKVNFINQILDDQQCWVYADSSRLNQILVNLIENAIKFSPLNGIIDIILKENNSDFTNENRSELDKSKNNSFVNSQILVGISDTGKGISTSIKSKLFEKFVTDSDTGTGLGLYITKKLVEAQGGRIWAFNNKDGVGSTFVFSLTKLTSNI
ncbi:MAG TPA: HAMP domain-containing sensor histidine kinase [Candidatus Nitrosocosmicus sp.]|nr:HAMP domain-containing sensor histidine kinase [Candidatus Nitrosocosmicus sp.]